MTKTENNSNKTLKITPPEGYEIDEENSAFSEIKFKKLPERKVIEKWEDLGDINGYYIEMKSDILKTRCNCNTEDENKNVCRTKKQAEGLLALSQLSQLYSEFVGDWKVKIDPIDGIEKYYHIDIKQTGRDPYFIKSTSAFTSFLAFEKESDAIRFSELHIELIKQASVWY